MNLEQLIAFKLIKESRKNIEISNASIIVILAISISIIFFICSVGVMNGYTYGLLKIAFEVKTFHINLPAYYSLNDSIYIKNLLSQDKRVKYIGIYRETKALLSAKGKTTGIAFLRILPEEIFSKDEGFNKCIKLLAGKKSIEKNEIMISKKTAEKLKIKEGDYLYLIVYIKDNGIKVKRLKVSGIFTVGYIEFDEQFSMIGFNTGETIFKENLLYNIFIKLNDYKKAKAFSSSYITSGLHDMMDWYELNEYEIKALSFEKNVIVFIILLVIILASFNILTTINITIYEKTKEIGILKALGVKKNRIFNIFILYGIYLGLIGITLGIIFGLLFMNYLNELLSGLSDLINLISEFFYKIQKNFKPDLLPPSKIEFFSKDFYLDKIYTDISFFEIFTISFITFFLSLLSAILPSLKASKINPIEVIKNG